MLPTKLLKRAQSSASYEVFCNLTGIRGKSLVFLEYQHFNPWTLSASANLLAMERFVMRPHNKNSPKFIVISRQVCLSYPVNGLYIWQKIWRRGCPYALEYTRQVLKAILPSNSNLTTFSVHGRLFVNARMYSYSLHSPTSDASPITRVQKGILINHDHLLHSPCRGLEAFRLLCVMAFASSSSVNSRPFVIVFCVSKP